MSIITSPMLAATLDPKQMNKLVYPVLATYKLDGLRTLFVDNEVKSRKFKKIPNTYIRNELNKIFQTVSKNLNFSSCEFDGEILASKTFNFQESTHNIMSFEGEPDFVVYVFDIITDNLETTYQERMKLLATIDFNDKRIVKLLPTLINDEKELLAFEEKALDAGYEGIIIRSVDSPYKCGRSTNKEGYLLKLKRFSDSEAEIIGFEELEHNNNIAKKDAFGRSERSSCKENMVGGNTLGTLLVKDIKSAVEFRIGSGLDMAMREKIWNNKSDYLNKIVKYKFFSVGVKELPRHPVLLGFRHIDDMD